MSKLKIMTVCGFGLGSSMVLKMNLDAVLKDLGIEADVFTGDVSSATGTSCDYIFTSNELAGNIKSATSTPVVVINSFVDKAEIKEKAQAEIKSE
ncbi:PTS sugar transporter subunit IIB [Gracilibacillus alcaliphilus]|uniref:PTS sugar transporter subunit IIB n=1 Tax=Gracilibacillus alcaliphilus TaxID=1401441 RepID=UPI001957E3BA|nr:PTS sugar transporter subunit IIB [Gracilibacillus alcaliphilus]MBM7677523.1 PTS system ascorbate-specific IIB component [Gracilibacillus alcaliphilus]